VKDLHNHDGHHGLEVAQVSYKSECPPPHYTVLQRLWSLGKPETWTKPTQVSVMQSLTHLAGFDLSSLQLLLQLVTGCLHIAHLHAAIK
jgi:hypothetical protein